MILLVNIGAAAKIYPFHFKNDPLFNMTIFKAETFKFFALSLSNHYAGFPAFCTIITRKNRRSKMRLAEDLPDLQIKKAIGINWFEYDRVICPHAGTRDCDNILIGTHQAGICCHHADFNCHFHPPVPSRAAHRLSCFQSYGY